MQPPHDAMDQLLCRVSAPVLSLCSRLKALHSSFIAKATLPPMLLLSESTISHFH